MTFASDKRFELVDKDQRNTTLEAKGEALRVMSTTHDTSFRRMGIILSSDAAVPQLFVVSLDRPTVNKKTFLKPVFYTPYFSCASQRPYPTQ
jgi:hypothetical protein